jgi:transposase-like protein
VIEDVLNAVTSEGSAANVTVRILSADDEAEAAYLDSGGTICPHCSSTELSASGSDLHTSIVWQNVTCHSCGASWQDLYKLTHFANLVVPT